MKGVTWRLYCHCSVAPPQWNGFVWQAVTAQGWTEWPSTLSLQNMFWNSSLLICSCPAAQWHPQQLHEWTKGERETNLPEISLLPRRSTSPLSVGFVLLAAVWWQMSNPASQSRLGVEMPPWPQFFQDIVKLFKESKSCQPPITSNLEQDIRIIISNCTAMLAFCRTSHFD